MRKLWVKNNSLHPQWNREKIKTGFFQKPSKWQEMIIFFSFNINCGIEKNLNMSNMNYGNFVKK